MNNPADLRRLASVLIADALSVHYRDTTDVPGADKILTDAMYRAVDALEGQGERSMRIARQLLEALARYELAIGDAFSGPEMEHPQNVPAYVKQGTCSYCHAVRLVHCITDQEDDRHPRYACWEGCTETDPPSIVRGTE